MNGGKYMKDLFNAVAENAAYVASFFGIIVLLFVIAFILERIAQKANNIKEPIFTTKKIAFIGMFSALSVVLMMFEIPLPFAPSFYKLDFSEIPILVGSFAFGPAAGVTMEFIKIMLKLFIKGTSTAFVGDLANFAVGCSFILPASIIYSFKTSRKFALISCAVGTLILTIFGTAFNAVYLLPAFAKLYGMPMEVLLNMGVEINPLVKEGSIVSFVIACVAPLNLIKGTSVSLVTLLFYKPLSKALNFSVRSKKSNENK